MLGYVIMSVTLKFHVMLRHGIKNKFWFDNIKMKSIFSYVLLNVFWNFLYFLYAHFWVSQEKIQFLTISSLALGKAETIFRR